MAFRGRGRGRGGFGQGSATFAKQEPYEIFPEIKEYPEINLKQKEEFKKLIVWGEDLKKFWVSSPYHLESSGQDSERNRGIRKAPLSDFMTLTDDYVPAELASKNVKRSNKKVRWDPQSDLKRLDFFEKLDQGPQGQDDGEKEKKEDEDDEEDNEVIEEEEDDSGDDYDQNIDFDDDEDDFNMNDDIGDDEGYY
ncbi:putative DNA-directed RNA polymerase III, subunit Rpc31 [Helianthus debilis subsp. tardiflorus]